MSRICSPSKRFEIGLAAHPTFDGEGDGMARIDEVAAAAGVSISTVSYALSGKRSISPDTRRRVEAAATRLGYQPHAGARALAGRRTQIFALTEPLRADTHAPTHMAFVLAASVAARLREYDILLLTDEQASKGMQRVAASDLVDAVLVLDVAPDDERVAIARSLRIPTVFIGIPNDHDGLDCVDLDFEAAAVMAVDRLVDAGHEHVALLGQSEVAYRASNFPPRLRSSMRERAEARGVAHRFDHSGRTTTDVRAVRASVADALDAGVTGFLIHAAEDAHDAALAVIAERRLQVGRDVSVISVATVFDTSRLPSPVDTIPLVPSASCEVAVELAIARLQDPGRAPVVHLIQPEYRTAGSVSRRR
ncbi:LacI family DNA-binding transcriptional regulator [Microbacterium dauci]|uniref:LacI family DNA-binding transcriptional regulator n=1 Tax=Microbacterium dauci TaxID=3048008 RepID=A0ABT6Z9L6_9MICO|nr:LacI family DNA-binding transcriptional regulator [Microbacterium sp. LX3-4]MDJ1112844.1 LacI family DNA-binding transcriptional regulator [Microbacterium sp. LX3-4]